MFKSQSNIKIILLFLIVIVGTLFFIINRKITNEFRTELNNQVRTIVNIYHQKVLYSEDNSDGSLFKRPSLKISVPPIAFGLI